MKGQIAGRRARRQFDVKSFLPTVGAGCTIENYKQGRSIFLQGDPSDAVFFIQKGEVQITVVSKHGKEGLIAMLGAGESFGEGCLVGQPLHIATATAMTGSTIAWIDRDTMVRVLREESELS